MATKDKSIFAANTLLVESTFPDYFCKGLCCHFTLFKINADSAKTRRNKLFFLCISIKRKEKYQEG